MSLGWPEFEEAGRSLAALSLRCGDGWQWVEQREVSYSTRERRRGADKW